MTNCPKIEWPIFADPSNGNSETVAELVSFSFQETLALPEDGCCLVTTSGDKTLMKDFPSNQSDIVLEGASAHPFFPFVGRTVKLSNPPPQNSDRGGLHLDLGDRSTNETNRPEVKELFPLITFAATLLAAGQVPITDVCFGPSLFPSGTIDDKWVCDIIKKFKQSSLRRLTLVIPHKVKKKTRQAIQDTKKLKFPESDSKTFEDETDKALRHCLMELKTKTKGKDRNKTSWPNPVVKTIQEIHDSIPDSSEDPTTIFTLSLHGRRLVEALAISVTPSKKRKDGNFGVRELIENAKTHAVDPVLTDLIVSYTYCLKNIGNDAAHHDSKNRREWALPLVYCLLSLTSWMDGHSPGKNRK